MRTRPQTRVGLLAVAAALGAAGCGSSANYANDPRPPDAVGVDAAVTQGRLTVAPDHIGAGPIRLTIANLSSRSREVRIDPVDAGTAGARSGPINPQGTAQLSLDVHEGTYRLRASGGPSTTLKVGRSRPSAQNTLLLP